MPREKRFWLLKSEPTELAFDDLWARKGRRTSWDGIRNHQARNLLRDELQRGDAVLFYHSSADPTGVAGVAEVASRPYPDPTQFRSDDPRHDPRATREQPIWYAVDVRAVAKLPRVVPLDELKRNPALARMAVVQRGNRLSVQPVTRAEFEEVLRMAGAREP